MQIELNKFQRITMSYWLQARISEVSSRDIVDMYNDVLWLKELLEECMDDMKNQSDASYFSDLDAHLDYCDRNQGRM